MKAVVAAFNLEKALVGAFSVITNLRMDLFEALVHTVCDDPSLLPATVDDKLVHVTSSSHDTSDSSALLHYGQVDKW